jgi:hypothetical protein
VKAFFLRLFYKYSGLSEILKDIQKDISLDPEIISLIRPLKYKKQDSMDILRELMQITGVNIEIKESKSGVDLRRKMAALAANVTTLNIENSEEVLWRIAEKLRVKRSLQQ